METLTFYSGDTITVELDLRDESGIGHVVGVFAHSDPGIPVYGDPPSYYEDIRLRGNGEGRPEATVVVTGKVEQSTAPGEYVCRFVQGYDAQGHYRLFPPGPAIRFRVENVPGDREGSNRSSVFPPLRQPWRRLFGLIVNR